MSRKGSKASEETRQKMRDTSKNPETIARRQAAQQRIGQDPEIKKRRSENSTKQWEDEEFYLEHTGENHPFFGKKHTDETKHKIGEKSKGNKHGERLKGRKQSPEHVANRFNARAGWKPTPEQVERSRQGLIRHYKEHPEAIRRGEYSPNWNGGSSYVPYDEEFNELFKEYIRIRLNYVCADVNDACSDAHVRLSIHHIDRNKKNTTPENCIALCRSHHSKSHNEKARVRHREFVRILMENEKN